MSLRAKIEAVIYAAEDPVTLAQLAAIFAGELPQPAEPAKEPESLLEAGFVEALTMPGPENDIAEVAMLTGLRERKDAEVHSDEADAKRAARQRDREAREQLKAIVDELAADYANQDRGMEIREVAGGYRIATKPEYHDAVRTFVKNLKPAMKLSLQALETLAVIAYKQPVTAPEVSEIRGVDSGGVLGNLVGRKLITTAGRKQVVGRPILYKTTREFLLRFGLKDIHELPSLEEFEKLAGEIGEDDGMTERDGPEAPSLHFGSHDEGASNGVPADSALSSVEANAGEAGVSVESADVQGENGSGDEQPAELVALDAELPDAVQTEGVEVAAPVHPTVPSEEPPTDEASREGE